MGGLTLIVIGLVGKICSGKDLGIEVFKQNGFKEINVDQIGHKALGAKQEELVKAFSTDILSGDIIDRKKLAKVVFNNEDNLNTLNSIVHPWMIEEVKKELNEDKCIINAALLYQMKLDTLCNFVVYIHSPYSEREKRAVELRKMDKEDFKKRNEVQNDLDQYLFTSQKQITIINDKTIDVYYRQIELLCAIVNKRGIFNENNN